MPATRLSRPLLCRLERHAPAPYPRWNDGYYFTKCLRCGEDLVRVAGEHWRRPHGFRVVWSALPPQRPAAPQIIAGAAEVLPPTGPAPIGQASIDPPSTDPAPIHQVATPLDDGVVSRATALFGDPPQPGGVAELEDEVPPIVLLAPDDDAASRDMAALAAVGDGDDDIGDPAHADAPDGGAAVARDQIDPPEPTPAEATPAEAKLAEPVPPGATLDESKDAESKDAESKGDEAIGGEATGDVATESGAVMRRSVVPNFMDDNFPRTPQAEPYVMTISQMAHKVPRYIAGARLPGATVGDAGPASAGRGEGDDRWGLNRIGLKYLSGMIQRSRDDARAARLPPQGPQPRGTVPRARPPRVFPSAAAPLPKPAPAILPLAIAPSALPPAGVSSGTASNIPMPRTYQAAAWATVAVLLIAVARLIFPGGDSAAKPVVAQAVAQPATRMSTRVPAAPATAASANVEPIAAEVGPATATNTATNTDTATAATATVATDAAATAATDVSVSASILSCRDAPSRSAARSMTLSRGLRVEVLSVAGSWSRIAYRGKPCWVSSRLLSAG